MRITLLTDADVFAGTERHMLDLARGLRAEGAEVTLACPRPGVLAERGDAEGFSVLEVAKRGLVDRAAIRILVDHLRAGRADVIHAHNGRTLLNAALAVQFARRGICVATQHFLEPNHSKQSGPKALIMGMAHQWVAGRTAAKIAISEAVRDGMRARQEIDEARVTVVPNGISEPDLTGMGSPGAIRREFGVPSDAPLIVCAARLEKEKDVASLISAVAEVRQAVPNVRCLVAGQGSLRETLEAQIASLGLAETVTLAGFRPDVLALMRAADVFVLPSLAEPFGLVILEAMALGKAVIATDAGGPREIVVSGETGLLVTPGAPKALAESLKRLLEDEALRDAMGRAGRARYEAQFTAGRMAQATLQVYRKVGRP